MSYPIEEIEGIGPANGTKLKAAGINDTDALLKLCSDKKGRDAMAEKSGIGASTLLNWANMADMMRVKGVGRQYSELLKASGVDTIKELRTRRADNLATKMSEVNAAKKLAKATPNESMIAGWIEAAKTMDPLITH